MADLPRVLRAIGQDLEKLRLDVFEIELTGETCMVRGEEPARPTPMANKKNEGLFKTAWRRIFNKNEESQNLQFQPATTPFLRTYNQDDINQLDKIGAGRRTRAVRTPDLYTLGERLRAVARIVHSKGGQLVKLQKDNRNNITVSYLDGNGQTQTEEYSNSVLHRHQQEYYAKRRKANPDDPWYYNNR